MIFITETDLKTIIKDEDLTRLTGGDSSLLDGAEAFAIGELKAYLSARFDLDTDLAKTGADRSQLLITWLSSLMVFRLHFRISPRNVSESIEADRDLIIAQVERVLKDEANPVGLTPLLDEDGEAIKHVIIQTKTPNNYRFFD